MNIFILVIMLIAGIMLAFSTSRDGCLSIVIGIILIGFSVLSFVGVIDMSDKNPIEEISLGQYQMEVQEANEDNDDTIKDMANWLIKNSTNQFKLVKYSNGFGCVVFEGTENESVYTLSSKDLQKLFEKNYISFIF